MDRRKDLGEISGQYSDLVILTEEDPGEEDTVETICREIAQYVAQGSCDYSIVPDRGEAIQQAVMSCRRAHGHPASPARGRRPARSAASSILTAPLT